MNWAGFTWNQRCLGTANSRPTCETAVEITIEDAALENGAVVATVNEAGVKMAAVVVDYRDAPMTAMDRHLHTSDRHVNNRPPADLAAASSACDW